MLKKEYIVKEQPSRLPVHPGIVLKEDVLPCLRLSISTAAKELGITRQALHRILNGTHSITPAMALRLGRFCNNNPMFWLKMQQYHDLKKAEIRLAEEIQKIPVHGALPLQV